MVPKLKVLVVEKVFVGPTRAELQLHGCTYTWTTKLTALRELTCTLFGVVWTTHYGDKRWSLALPQLTNLALLCSLASVGVRNAADVSALPKLTQLTALGAEMSRSDFVVCLQSLTGLKSLTAKLSHYAYDGTEDSLALLRELPAAAASQEASGRP